MRIPLTALLLLAAACAGQPAGGPGATGDNFETRLIADRAVPLNLPAMTQFLFANLARGWRDDAIPVMLDVNEQGRDSDCEVVLYFVSPSTGAGLRVAIQRGDMLVRHLDRVSWGDRAVPLNFVDLAPLLETAYEAGMTGALRSAQLRSWDGYGPAWMLLPHGPRGRTYSALDGREIREDVTGYVASYNRQWDEAIAGIESLIRSAAPLVGGGLSGQLGEDPTGSKAAACGGQGGNWHGGSCWGDDFTYIRID